MSINGVKDRDTLWIGGDWVPSDGGGSIEVISPHTEQVIATVPEASTADVDNAVAAARAALESGPWATMEPAGRAEVLTNLTGALGGRAEDLAQTITAEMGSPIMFSHLGQVGATLMVADYYANLAKDFTFEEERQGLMSSVLVRREPVGVVGAIVPWNVPLYVTMLKLAPALAAGATMVLKPAPESPLSAYLLAEALEEVGLPKGVVNVLPAGREVGEHLVRHPGVDKIAFTGSTAAGMKIASICGEQLKRYTLELGGKSAAIILDDADVDTTLDNLLQVAGLMNNGQACVAQTRVLASRAKYDEVVSGLATRMAAVKVGDPAEMDTEVGPLVAERQRDRVEKYIVQGQEEGAEVVVGGGRPAGQDTGWYVEPTLFAKVTNDMRIAQEEIFGPVISAIPFDDVDDAVAIANDSTYGLSGSVWTADAEAGLGIAKRVRTGTFNVNGFMLEPCAPFGGYTPAGVGGAGGPEGLAAYLEDKAINRF
ncbi:MAG: aldehyde dehydrogenase [Acidimicrobiales bacterium]